MREMADESVQRTYFRAYETTLPLSTGKIQTVDGRTLGLQSRPQYVCRTFACERTVNEQGTIQLRDPLVINFDGKAELSGKLLCL